MKRLTQAVFDLPECPEWAESAAVDASGYAHWFNCEVAPCHATGCFDVKYTDYECIFEMKKIGSGYDTTNWQQSAIDRGEE